MPTTTPGHGWPIPTLTESGDGPAAIGALAQAIEDTLDSKSQQSYTPSWASDGTVQPTNPSSRTGLYRVVGAYCDFNAVINFGASTNGGRGILKVGLPVAASASATEQWVIANLLIGNSTRWGGWGHIQATSPTFVRPVFPVSDTGSWLANWMSQDITGSAGYPGIGSPTVVNGGNVRVNGRYVIA